MKKIKIRWLHSLLLWFSQPALAVNSYNIGNSQNAGFQLIVAFWQDYVNFMVGPFAKVAAVGSLLIAIGAWMFLPKEGLVSSLVRVAIGAIGMLNVVTWLGVLGG